MQLISLHVYKTGWQPGKESLMGEIQFGSDTTKTSLKLTDEQARKIINLVADQVVESAVDLSKALKLDVATNQLLTIAPPVLDAEVVG